MAFDGFTIACLCDEFNKKLLGGRITKVAQPEKDELQLTIKSDDTYKLLISANASLPLIYITEDNKQGPVTAPAFCMLLRKHLNSARIVGITQGEKSVRSMERAVDFSIEHLDELGDLRVKHLIVEIMGKHSNIIFCDEEYRIIDSIKRVNSFMSSVREVLPGREYFLPQTVDKADPLDLSFESFQHFVTSKNKPLPKAVYSGLIGFSPMIAECIVEQAGLDPELPACELSEDLQLHLYKNVVRTIDTVKEGDFKPILICEASDPSDYCVIEFSRCAPAGRTFDRYTSVSKLLSDFYSQKNAVTLIRQKSADLRKIVNTCLERETKKLELQRKQMADTEKRDIYKLYGELITTYGYGVEPGSREMTANNYYIGEDVTIPLDPDLSPIENAKKYYEKFSKLKRTFEALTVYIAETEKALEHLSSISLALDIATCEEDLMQVRRELEDSGFAKRHSFDKGKMKKTEKRIKSQPLHYVSKEGIHYYVGKNNTQNDELTFHFAENSDWWFHAKGCPGSHVIMKSTGSDMPDKAFEDGGALAAYYSAADRNGKVEVDYVKKKEVKKPNNGVPGFVVYYTNYSLVAVPDIGHLDLIR